MRYLAIFVFAFFLPGLALSADTAAFKVVRGYTEAPGTTREVSNMPRVRTQGQLPMCYAMTASVVAQRHICNLKGIADCANLTGAEKSIEISPLSMLAWSKVSSPERAVDSFLSYLSLDFTGGGSSTTALAVGGDYFVFAKDSCFDFDKFVRHYGSISSTPEQAEEKAIQWELAYAELKYVFEKNKNPSLRAAMKTPSSSPQDECIDCVLVNRNLFTRIDRKRPDEALEKNSFREFLYNLLLGNCGRFAFAPRPTWQVYPGPGQTTSKDELRQKIMRVVDNKLPVALQGICLSRDGANECTQFHSVVIAGHKQVCITPGNCRILFKVHNSWGIEWQDQYDNGWVDANSILENINYSRNGMLSWYE